MSVKRIRRTGNQYPCTLCKGTGHLHLSDPYQVVLDAAREMPVSFTRRQLFAKLPDLTPATINGRFAFLIAKGFIEIAVSAADQPDFYGTTYRVVETSP